MALLRIRLLGAVQVFHSSGGDQREDRGRRCLSTALWRLKQALEPDGVQPGAYLISTPGTVGFRDIMNKQGISLYYRDRPYEGYAAVMRAVVPVFGLDAMARAYFFGQVQSLRTSMEARWGTNWHAVAGATTVGDKDRALRQIPQLEAAYRKRLEDLIRQSPQGDFPTPSRTRVLA